MEQWAAVTVVAIPSQPALCEYSHDLEGPAALLFALPHVSSRQATNLIHGPCVLSSSFLGVHATSQRVPWGETLVHVE